MKKTINFTKMRFFMLALSAVLIVAGIAGYFIRGGFNLGIDFQPGLVERYQIDTSVSAEIEDVRAALSGEGVQIQTVGGDTEQEYMIRVEINEDNQAEKNAIQQQLATDLANAFGSENIERRSSEFVGPRFSQSVSGQVFFLTIFALALILVYIWIRFELGYAVSAIVAIFHDVIILLGFITVFQLEVSTATIAAVLTIIGYSLNDTIVIFDRIRENSKLIKDESFESIINKSINQSISRTIMTSLTTLLAVVSIYIFATGAIRLFALNFIVGILIGTYSSMFIASPILLAWHNVENRRQKKIKK